MSKYQMWISADNGERRYQFPVLPEKIDIVYPGFSSSVRIDGIGDVRIYKDGGAKKVSFSSYFPKIKGPEVGTQALSSPIVIALVLELLMQKNTVVQFFITGTPVNMPCIIESFNVYEKGGDVGTLYYSIVFALYRKAELRQVNVSSRGVVTAGGGARRIDSSEAVTSYTVKKGDWLCKISRALLGDSSRYMEIYNLNRDILSNPNLIYEGQVLKIPAK